MLSEVPPCLCFVRISFSPFSLRGCFKGSSGQHSWVLWRGDRAWDRDLAGCWLASKYATQCGPYSSFAGERHVIFTDQWSLSIEPLAGELCFRDRKRYNCALPLLYVCHAELLTQTKIPLTHLLRAARVLALLLLSSLQQTQPILISQFI